jgi:sugar lactone lactonase YvrE
MKKDPKMKLALLALAVPMVIGAAATPPLKPWPAAPAGKVTIERIAYFPDQQTTGVAVSKTGRVFVSLPRLTVDVPVSVGDVVDGKIVAYPDAGWNGYRFAGGDAVHQFVCAQAVVMDNRDNLWVLDAATPKRQGPVAGGPKLVKIDPRTNVVLGIYRFPADVVPEGTSLNDVRLSPDGAFAYLSNVGNKTGGLIVMDLRSGKAWRMLDGDPSTQADPSVQLHADGKALIGRDGKGLSINVDGIAISADGKTFYWQALTGKTVYALPTAVMQDPTKAAHARPVKVATTHAADGLWIDAAGRFFVTNPGEDSIEVADKVGGPLRLLVKDKRMRWPDSFSQGADGSL